VAEHGLLERLQRRARLDPEVLDESDPRLAIGVERLLLSPAAVEREHLLLAETLAIRMRGDQQLELREQPVVPAERELRLVPQLDRLESPLLEVGDRRSCERLLGEIRQGRSAPEPQSCLQVLDGSAGGACCDCPRPSGDQLLEPSQVELVLVEPHPVAAAERLDAVGAERTAKPVDVDLERRGGGRWGLFTPDRLDQRRSRNDPAVLEQETREHRALLRRPEVHALVVDSDLERPEYPEFGSAHDPFATRTSERQADLKRPA
jgi:hypothetical protein